MDVVRDFMIVDSVLQAQVLARVRAGGFGNVVDRTTVGLGRIAVPGLGEVNLWLRHAADAVLIDGRRQVVLITRAHNPGAGKLALPGGFIDAPGSVVEQPMAAARREALEETGISPAFLVGGVPVGARRYERPFDIRVTWRAMPDAGIALNDLFIVSTQGFLFAVPGDLRDVALLAGDDAKRVQICEIASLAVGDFAVPDHLEMIKEGVAIR
jgi:ADP-ribose pyrophosphatase YjhB (NUDIX family)